MALRSFAKKEVNMALKKLHRSEAQEQTDLFCWASYFPELEHMFAIPNGGSRHPAEAANLKRQGVKAGVPDIFIPAPKGKYHGAFIEMKVRKNKTTDNQNRWLAYLSSAGYFTAVCYGFEEARKVIEAYLKCEV